MVLNDGCKSHIFIVSQFWVFSLMGYYKMRENLIFFVVCRCLRPCLLGCDMHVKIVSHGCRSYCVKPDCLYVDLSSLLTESNKMSLYAAATNAGTFLSDNLCPINGPFGKSILFRIQTKILCNFCRSKSTVNTFSMQYLRVPLYFKSA